jgi:hypothetical protein
MGLEMGYGWYPNPISRPMADMKARKGEVRKKIVIGNWTSYLTLDEP